MHRLAFSEYQESSSASLPVLFSTSQASAYTYGRRDRADLLLDIILVRVARFHLVKLPLI